MQAAAPRREPPPHWGEAAEPAGEEEAAAGGVRVCALGTLLEAESEALQAVHGLAEQTLAKSGGVIDMSGPVRGG